MSEKFKLYEAYIREVSTRPIQENDSCGEGWIRGFDAAKSIFDQLQARVASLEAENEQFKKHLNAKQTLKEMNYEEIKILKGQIDKLESLNARYRSALKEYDRQVSKLYISNWTNEEAMKALIYDCPKALNDDGAGE